MSSSSHSPQHQQNQETNLVVQQEDSQSQISTNQEPTNETRPDPETIPAHDPAGPEEEEEEDEAEEGPEEIPPGMPQPITEPHVSTQTPNPRRAANKRKKGKGKVKGKPNIKKQQSIDKKVHSLMEKLNPIPFRPNKILDFPKHESLLRRLGLWDFVHIDFDRNLRLDLLAQLVATYESRHSYVNGFRIGVNRAELARAFKMPGKKDKASVGVVQMDLDTEVLSEESIGFMLEFVSDWVLLHEDTWIMPNEVMNWLKTIKDGHPEKVDWAGLIWFMMEKELMQGVKLENCYYASHLQYLMKAQKVFLKEEAAAKMVELNTVLEEVEEDVKEENVQEVTGAIEGQGEENSAVEGPSIELRLGQDGEKEEAAKDAEIMDVEKCKKSDEDGGGEEQGRWLLDGKNNVGEHFLQHCGVANGDEFGSFQDGKVVENDMELEEGEEEAGEEFHGFPIDDAPEEDELTGDFLQAMKANQIAFSSQEQFHDPSSMDIRTEMQQMDPTPSFFNQAGKRVIEHENVISHHSLHARDKRLRINDSWDLKPVDFGTCIESVQQMMEKAKMFYEEKEQALEQSNMNQQILLNEIQKRDDLIDVLHKSKTEEMQKKDGEIYRLQRELYIVGNVLDGYRKALKDTQKAFDQYRQRVLLPEESTYKDAAPGGLMLSSAELERIRKKQEEENHMIFLMTKQKIKEFEEGFDGVFHEYIEKVNMFDTRLKGLATDVKVLVELYAKQQIPRVEEAPEVAEEAPEVGEEAPEVAEEAPEVAEEAPEVGEEAPEVAEEAPEVAEEAPEVGEEAPEVAEEAPEVAEEVPEDAEGVPELAEPIPDE